VGTLWRTCVAVLLSAVLRVVNLRGRLLMATAAVAVFAAGGARGYLHHPLLLPALSQAAVRLYALHSTCGTAGGKGGAVYWRQA